LAGAINRSNCTVVFTNQLRMKVGIMFGNPETTPGGRALKYYSTVRMDIRRIQSLKEDDEFSGIKVRVKVVKNKVAPPFRTAEFDIMFKEGISKEGNLIDVGVDFDIIKKSGAWYEYNGEKLGQGRENAKAYLKENPKISQEIEKKIRASLGKEHEVPMEIGGDHEEEKSQ
jgi:recombination protein RecA